MERHKPEESYLHCRASS